MLDWIKDFASNNAQLVASVVVILVVIHLCSAAVAYLILLERKIAAWAQDRVGPNFRRPARAASSPSPMASSSSSEDLPAGRPHLFIIAPGLTAITALIGFAVIPWAGELTIWGHTVKMTGADVNIGIIISSPRVPWVCTVALAAGRPTASTFLGG
jgi:NADH-quinone oxidoreductase subunit H